MPENCAPVKRLVHWIDRHPRTGWYVAVVVTVNLAVSILNLVD